MSQDDGGVVPTAFLRCACIGLAVCAMLAGAVCILNAGTLWGTPESVIAGAILVGAGLTSLTLLSRQTK